jgi:hypothetical protein
MSSNQIKQSKKLLKKAIHRRRGRISQLLAVLAVQRKLIKKNEAVIRKLTKIRNERAKNKQKNEPSRVNSKAFPN